MKTPRKRITSPKFDRRTALKLLGASTVGAALPWLGTRSASAQSGDVPLRLLFIEAGPGCRRTTFEPAVAGPAFVPQTSVVTDWAFREVMSALEPYRDRATFFENLDMVSVKEDPSGAANAHTDGLTHMLTADSRHQGSPDLGAGPSIDQLIAQHLNADGPLTRLPSLEVMVTESAGQYSRSQLHHAYSAPGQQVPFLKYVPDIWDRIFPEPVDADASQAAARAARQTSVYDFVRGDYERLIGRLGGEDREKIQQMLDYRAELQASLSVTSDRAANRPDSATILDPWSQLDEGYQKGHVDNRLWKTHAELIGKMAAAALHTDTTRVVNLSFDTPPSYEFGYSDGDYGSSDWHDLDHKVSGDEPQLTDPQAAETIDELHRVVYGQVRLVLDELAGLQETDGQSLLDHTLVVLCSHIAEGSHDVTRLPWVVIGDAHGFLKTGQYIRFPITETSSGQVLTEFQGSRVYSARGRAHGDLFVTIARAMGVGLDRFGNSSLGEAKGTIAEMLA